LKKDEILSLSKLPDIIGKEIGQRERELGSHEDGAIEDVKWKQERLSHSVYGNEREERRKKSIATNGIKFRRGNLKCEFGVKPLSLGYKDFSDGF